MIEYYKNNDIDRQRWDDCIRQAVNRLPYAMSWWLDAVCPSWDALVQDDYGAVMPLTHGHKFGIDYLYQPYFTQQLGIFSNSDIPVGADEFLDVIPNRYRYVQIQLNADNMIKGSDFTISLRRNYLLDLTPTFIELETQYHRNCRRNIQKAIHSGLKVKPGPGPVLFIEFIRKNLERQLTDTRKSFYPSLLRIIQASFQNKTGEIIGVYSPAGELMASGWFITNLGRCLFEVCASTREGKNKQAMYLLVDQMIREKSGTGLLFDFAGSNVEGIAYFNAGFGARKSYYPALHRNNLPWPVRLLKK